MAPSMKDAVLLGAIVIVANAATGPADNGRAIRPPMGTYDLHAHS